VSLSISKKYSERNERERERERERESKKRKANSIIMGHLGAGRVRS
jgi:hypothetical protein